MNWEKQNFNWKHEKRVQDTGRSTKTRFFPSKSITWRLLGKKPGQSYWIFLPIESAATRRAVFCLLMAKSCFLSLPLFRESRRGGCRKTFSHTFLGCNLLHQYSCKFHYDACIIIMQVKHATENKFLEHHSSTISYNKWFHI